MLQPKRLISWGEYFFVSFVEGIEKWEWMGLSKRVGQWKLVEQCWLKKAFEEIREEKSWSKIIEVCIEIFERIKEINETMVINKSFGRGIVEIKNVE